MFAAYPHLTATKSPRSGMAVACTRDVNEIALPSGTTLARRCMR